MRRFAARLAAPALLALMTVALALPVPGCAGSFAQVQKDLPEITSAINEAVLAESTIETFVNGYLANHSSPDAQAKVASVETKVKLALALVQSLANGAGDLSGGQAQAALTDFYNAYAELLSLVKSFGVTPAGPSATGGPMLATSGDRLVVPAPGDLRLMKHRRT